MGWCAGSGVWCGVSMGVLEMNKIEALRKEADLREMCEGTTVQWWECVKIGKSNPISLDNGLFWINQADEEKLNFALAIVENKPVFVGDEPYDKEGYKLTVTRISFGHLTDDINKLAALPCDLSWSPPKPKTVMVELPVAAVEYYAMLDYPSVHFKDVPQACRKALEQLNGGGK